MQPEADSNPNQPSRWRRLWTTFGGRAEARAGARSEQRGGVPIPGWSRFDWLSPWQPVAADESLALTRELERELCPSHALFGQPLVAVGRRSDGPEVLYRWRDDSDRAVIVHLTFSAECDPKWPTYEKLSSRAAFLRHMATDHGDFEDGAAL